MLGENSRHQASSISPPALIKKSVAIAAAVALGSLVLAACGGDESDESSEGTTADIPPSEVTLAQLPVFDVAPLVAAQRLGYFDDVNMTFDIQTVVDERAAAQALASGSAEIALISELALVPSLPAFKNFRTILNPNIFRGFAVITRPDGNYRTFEEISEEIPDRDEAIRETARQVEGGTFVVQLGTAFDTVIDRVLELADANLTRNDVEFIDIPPAEGATAFLRGEGDFWMGDVPNRFRLEEEGFVPLITAEEMGPKAFVYDLVNSTEEYIGENEDTVLRFLSVWYRVADDLQGPNRDEVLEAMGDYVNEEAGTSFEQEVVERVDSEVSPSPTFEEAKEVYYTPGVETHWPDRLQFAVDTRVEQDIIPRGSVDPEMIDAATGLYERMEELKQQAEDCIAEDAADDIELVEERVAQRNYLDAARLCE